MRFNALPWFAMTVTIWLPAVISYEGFSSNDIHNIGNFIAELARGLRMSVVALCVEKNEVYYRLLSVLMHNMVFSVSCGVDVAPVEGIQDPLLPVHRKGGGEEGSSSRTLVEVHLTSRAIFSSTLTLVRERYVATEGRVWQVVLGEDLPPKTNVQKGVATWLVANYDKTTEQVSVTEVYSFRDSEDVVVQGLGNWTPQGRLQLQQNPGHGPINFQGHVITLASFPYPPYVMLGKTCSLREADAFNYDPSCFTSPSPHLVAKKPYVGYLIDIIEAAAASLNFSYRIKLPEDKDGYLFGVGGSGNQSGLVGMVSKGEAEIVLASLSISKDRSRVIDFSTHIDYYVRNLYIDMRATTSSVGWGTYAISFSLSTWLGTAGLVVIAAFTLWVLHQREKQVPSDLVSFRDVLFMFFSCLVQQGVPSTPYTYRGRIIFWLFWFACVILYASYTAGLTSSLTVSTEGPPFSTLKEAVEKYPEWQVGISKGTAIEEYIKDSQGDEYRKLTSLLSADPGLYVSSEEEGINRMLTSKFVLFTDGPIMKFMLKNNCSIREIHVNLFRSYGHLGYMKNLPFAGVIDAELSRLSDGGVLDRLSKKWWGRGTPCGEPSRFTELGFSHTATAFLILVAGLAVALFLFIYEILYERKSPSCVCGSHKVQSSKPSERETKNKTSVSRELKFQVQEELASSGMQAHR